MTEYTLRFLWSYLLFGWLATFVYNWYLIEKTVKANGGDGPWVTRGRYYFPHVLTKHPDCPPELARIHRICTRWIFGTFAVFVIAMYFWNWLPHPRG